MTESGAIIAKDFWGADHIVDVYIRNGALTEKFILPPFTLLDTRQGPWQERRRMWGLLGMQSELGRPAHNMAIEAEHIGEQYGRKSMDSVSIFDPVLCEIMYKWFCTPGGTVLDPFAGGSVRGIVASKLGYRYNGVELRQEQVDANVIQGESILKSTVPVARWICGDSLQVQQLAPAEYDFIFTCPPYGDVEVYSDDPRDLSTMPYVRFIANYRLIIERSCSMLRNDRFACMVVSNFRSSGEEYLHDFVGDTITAFRRCGLELLNEAILINSLGTLPIRAARGFKRSRKLGRTHQTILVFCKGDAYAAAQQCGEVDTGFQFSADQLADTEEDDAD